MPYADSAPVVTELALIGAWIHDPAIGGEDSTRSFPYGASQRDDSLDNMGEAAYYAGRRDPVVDYGEHQAASVGVTLDVPHGVTWREDLDYLEDVASGRRTIHFRDNRGRELYGQVTGYRRKDVDWGTQVSFTVARSHWDTETVG